MNRPLVALTARSLGDDRVRGWHAPGAGERSSYAHRVRAAGGWPVLCDPSALDPNDVVSFLGRFDAVVLTGGPDVDPARYGETPDPTVYGTDTVVDGFEFAIAIAAIERELPILAICRGAQVVNVAMGGSLYQDIPTDPGVDRHGQPGTRNGELRHTVAIESHSLLASVMGTTTADVSCHHHQSIRQLGAGLVIAASAHDGIVEAIELPGKPLLAVQWHPEDTAADDPAHQALFDWLCGR